MNKTIFRKASIDKISSPDQLNDYIKVSNPSVWIALAALFILLAAVFVWGFTGSLPTTVHTKGIAEGGSVACYVRTDDAASIRAGQAVKMQAIGLDTAVSGKVAVVGTVPMSQAEIAAELKSDYLVQELAQDKFSVAITITPEKADLADGTMLDLYIVTDSVRPADFLMK